MTRPADSEAVRLTKREALPLAQRACAIAHGKGVGMSLLRLWELVLEDGLPSRTERERMLAERLNEDRVGDTTPSGLLNGNPPDATAGV